MVQLHPAKIIDVVSRVTDVTLDVLLSEDRHKHIAMARFAAYYVLREHGFSYPVIGTCLERDHTSVMAGYKKAKEHFETNHEFKQLITTIIVALERVKETQMPAPPTFDEFAARCTQRLETIKVTNDEGVYAQRYYEDVTILLRLLQSKNETPEVLYQRTL